MDPVQFERLLQAIDRNTDASIETGKQIGRLADECVTLATMLADPESEEDQAPTRDLAGRPL